MSVSVRKRHVLVDTLGLLLEVMVTTANTSDQRGLRGLLQHARHELPRLHHLWVDQGYRGRAFISAMLLAFGVVLEVVGKRGKQKGFHLQARRWVKGVWPGMVIIGVWQGIMRYSPNPVRASSTWLAVI